MTPEQPVDNEKIENIVKYLVSECETWARCARMKWRPKMRAEYFDLAEWYLNGARTVCLAQQFDTRDFVRTNQEGHV